MVIGSNMGMLSAPDDRVPAPTGDLGENLQGELDLILRARRSQRINNRGRDLNIYRSGSAPPTVEGSLTAVGSLFRNSNFGDANSIGNSSSNDVVLTEDEIRSHPEYLSYYYSHDNLNPRLPPPLISREDWRAAQRFRVGGSSLGVIGELWRKKLVDDGDSSSLFLMQPGHFVQKMENDLMEYRTPHRNIISRQTSAEWLDRGVGGLQGTRLGARRRSFADILQEGTSFSSDISCPASHISFGDVVDMIGTSGPHPAGLHDGAEPLESLVGVQGSAVSFGSAVGSLLSRSTMPEQPLVRRSTGSGLPPVWSGVGTTEKKNGMGTVQNVHSSGMTELAATLSGLSLSKVMHADQNNHIQGQVQIDVANQPDFLLNLSNGHNKSLPQQLADKSHAEYLSSPINYIDVSRKNGYIPNTNASQISSNREVRIPKRALSSSNLHSRVNSSGFGNLDRSSMDSIGHLPNAYSANQKMDTVIENHLDSASALGGPVIGGGLNKAGNQVGSDFLSTVLDPRYAQYLPETSDYATLAVTTSKGHRVRDYVGISHGDLDGIQKAYFEALLAQQNQQLEPTLQGKSGSLNQGYYRSPSYDLHMPYLRNSRASCVLSSAGSESFRNEQARFSSMMRSSVRGSSGLWDSDVGNNVEKKYASSLLDDFKNSKTRPYEISDILDHVVEFSTDQHGSRFIQQKLETATVEEKDKIFPEIISHALTLMTDVFGNYVIQKFFEHGTESQRMKLASQLTGHVLPLSLQMYGCRVIQKALEVIDVDQQTQMVTELSGSVIKCVHDQNGNHVIQKCIECVPEDRIQFIISAFYGQVMALSAHPYGCRVIQRVLENCENAKTRKIIMDEIMQSICTLAQDQYGNYVIQHIIEHGKLEEQSAIISKFAGQMVKMSQHKFASNVVEKCLTFGSPEKRQLLVTEILGSTEENGPLQAMMKDPFGNYVVQKVLETCDDQSLDLILSRIKVHLNALKRYTYGKHIVSRVEKLVTTGERHIGLSSSFTS